MTQSFNQFIQSQAPAFPGFQAPGTPAGYPAPGAPGLPQQAPAPVQAPPAAPPAQGFAPTVYAGQHAPGAGSGFAPPQGYAAPAPGLPSQQPSPAPQGAQGFGQSAPYTPGAFAGATLMGQRMPDADPGRYLFKVLSTEQAQRESGRQWELIVEVADGGPSPKGLQTMFTQGCNTPLQIKYTASFMLEVCMAIYKCTSEAEFKAKVPNWPALFDAMQNKNQQIVADFGPNPLAGQYFVGLVNMGDQRKDRQKNPIPGQFYRNVRCSPA